MVIQRDVITLKSLLCFSEVAKNGKINDTALKNGMKQSNLSNTIKSLEEELGFKLFNRVHDGVNLTENGRDFFEMSCDLQNILHRIRTYSLDKKTIAGTIRVWVSDGIGSSFIANYFSEFYMKYPDINLDITCSLENPKLSHEIDVGIVYQDPNFKECNIKERSEMIFKFYASQQYLNQFGYPHDLDDLLENHRVCSRNNYDRWEDWKALSPKIKHHVANTNTSAMLLSMVKNGTGIALLPTCAGARESELILLKKMDFEISHPFWIVTHQDREENPTVKTLINYLSEITKRL